MAPQRPYQWLLFDADGTLFDFPQAETLALSAALASFGLSMQPRYFDIYRDINRRVWQAFEQGKITTLTLRQQRSHDFLAAIGADISPQQFTETYLHHLGQQNMLLEGAEEVIQALSAVYELMLITNGLKEVQRARWATSSLRPYFADIVISDEIGAAKPDKRIFDTAFTRMNNPSRVQVLMIGDSLSADIQGGIDYGLDTCWLNPQGKPAPNHLPITYEIQNLRELLAILL